jgi:hypothetical protein
MLPSQTSALDHTRASGLLRRTNGSLMGAIALDSTICALEHNTV